MNEENLTSSENIVSAQTENPQMTGGTMLRMAREAEGLHIAALAVLLKVSVKRLEALESDRFDLLPDIVFVRALAASVCRTLKIDPAPILEMLPHTTAPILKTDSSGINTPFRTSGVGAGFIFWKQLTRPVVLAVVLLLIGVVALIFFPKATHIDVGNVVVPTENTLTQNSLNQSPRSDPLASENGDRTSQDDPTPLPSTLAINQLPITSISPQSGSESSILPVVVTGVTALNGVVVIKANKPSWVEVVDANGVVQLRKTLVDGEAIGVSGLEPLSVVIGRADTTEVKVRGKPFDLARIAKDNVARFEVK